MLNFVIDESKKAVRIVVHGGNFHADDVIATAIATIVFENIEVERLFDVPEDNKFDYIIDIGKAYDGEKYFDHHQDIANYDDGVHPCGATLFAEKVLSTDLYQCFYARFLKAIAIQDNGQKDLMVDNPNTMFGWVSAMNPCWNSDESYDDCFKKAVEMAIAIIQQIITGIEAETEAEAIFSERKEFAEGKILSLPRFIPWHKYVLPLEKALFVVHPSNRGGYAVQCVPPTRERHYEQRMPLPKEWFDGVKPEGCSFCHEKQFFAAFDTEENAIKALTSLVKENSFKAKEKHRFSDVLSTVKKFVKKLLE